MPTDDEVVETAAAAAEVDIYVNAPDSGADERRVADDAALAARGAVETLFD